MIGILGILLEAGKLGWIDLPEVLEQLRQITFRVSDSLIGQLLQEYGSQD